MYLTTSVQYRESEMRTFSGQGTDPDFVLLLKVFLAVLANGIKANPVKRQTDISDEAQEKSKQIQALMADIKGLEAKATARRDLEAKASARRDLDVKKQDNCWSKDTICLSCQYVSIYPLNCLTAAIFFFFKNKIVHI